MSRVTGQKPGRNAKGQQAAGAPSINPSGRPRLTPEQREAREALLAASPEAVAKLVDLMRHGEPETALKAAKVIVDKAVPDALDGEALSEASPFKALTVEALVALAKAETK